MRFLVTLSLLAVLLTGCLPVSRTTATATPLAPGSEITPGAQPGDDKLTRGTVYIDSMSIYTLDTNPPRFRLAISGSLPTPCHELRVAVLTANAYRRILVEAYSLVNPGKACTQVLQPFSATVSLDGNPAGQYSVLVNGQEVGQIMIPAGGETSFKGWELYSWQENGIFQYALLLGTNRNKTFDEISALDVRLVDIAAVKQRLATLAAGETIFWNVLDYGGGELPPQAVRDDLAAWCHERGLELVIGAPTP